MAQEKRKLTIRKVPVDSLLKLLNDLYSSGADFVDLHGIIDDETKQDQLTISTRDSYMNREYLENKEEMEKMEELEEENWDEQTYNSYEQPGLEDDDISNLLNHGL